MRAWLELLRISNLPTVWSNLIAGAVIAAMFDGRVVAWQMLVILVAGSALYLGGMVLNDVFDLEIDTRERPGRPLPSGRVSIRRASMAGWGLVVLGGLLPWTISIATGAVAVVLAGLVVLYDRIHARTARSVLVMAACRAALYLLAAMAVATGSPDDLPRDAMAGPGIALFLALPLFIHVASFSFIARFEAPPIEERCPRCGHQVLPDAATCPECGSRCDLEARTARAEARLGVHRSWWGTGTLALLVPFVGCCGVATVIVGTEPGRINAGAGTALGLGLAIAVLLGVRLVGTTRHLARNPRAVGRFVLRSIATMSLYDAAIVAMILFGGTGPTKAPTVIGAACVLACLGCFGLVRWSHRRIPGT